MPYETPVVHFASAIPDRMERDATLPARFLRLLDRTDVRTRVKGKRVAIKMHVGGSLGYTTIRPLFVKLLVDKVKEGKPRDVFIADGRVNGASDRGYTNETTGARLVSLFSKTGGDTRRKRTGWKYLKTAEVSKRILDADVLINFSHVKGHGNSGFGGACKNIAMGCVPGPTRAAIHSLAGSLKWDRDKCIRCGKCIEECPTKANKFTDAGEYDIFWHNCRMCLHCMMACPTGAIHIAGGTFERFQQGLAHVTNTILKTFKAGNVLHINVLTDITLYCDCWGMTTPSLVPDIGIMASSDIVAVEHASLKAIRVRDLIPGSITPPYTLGKGRHLFEKLHGKDPFVQVHELEKVGAGTTRYRVSRVK